MNNKAKSVAPKPAGGDPVAPKPKRTNEDKAAKFKELAKARTGKALKMVSNIGNLASSNYIYTPEQVAKIVAALKGAVTQVENQFTRPPKSEKPSFDL